jgi:hypothetical protein
MVEYVRVYVCLGETVGCHAVIVPPHDPMASLDAYW